MNEREYDSLLRVLGMLFAVLVWGVSVFFSVRGFQFDMNNQPWTFYISIILGLAVTVIELLWNRTDYGKDALFYIIGILVYCYGIYTNVVGILDARNVTNADLSIVLPIIFGLIIEIVPEKLFIKSLREWNAIKRGMSTNTQTSQKLNPRDVRTNKDTPFRPNPSTKGYHRNEPPYRTLPPEFPSHKRN